MESDIIQSAAFYRSWAWFEKNKRQVSYGAIAVIVLGLIAYYIVWQRQEKRSQASQALSAAFANSVVSGPSGSPDAYLAVVKEHSGSQAAAQARLFAGTTFFTEGKYEQALSEFQKFLQENPGSSYAAQAILGVAASFEALGKADQALERYTSLVERYPSSPVLAQAKFSLARLREAKGDLEKALLLYEELGRDQFSSLGTEAGIRAEEIKRKRPDLAAKVQSASVPVLKPMAATATNRSVALPVKTNATAPPVTK